MSGLCINDLEFIKVPHNTLETLDRTIESQSLKYNVIDCSKQMLVDQSYYLYKIWIYEKIFL